MKRTILIGIMAMATLSAESLTQKWLRRSIAVGACVVSGIDAYQSQTAIGHNGLIEINGALAGPGGSFRLGKALSIKAPLCIAPIVLGEFRRTRLPATVLSGSTLGVFSFVALRNHAEIARVQPGEVAK